MRGTDTTTLPPTEAADTSIKAVALHSRFSPSLIGLPLEESMVRWSVEATDGCEASIGYQLRVRSNDGEWIEYQPVSGTDDQSATAPGGPLAERERRDCSVRVATPNGWSAWSAPLRLEGGLAANSFDSDVIGLESPVEGPCALLRKEFNLDFEPVRARLYLSALGLVDARINGRPASDRQLTPGWTEYSERILVDSLDVTDRLRRGSNAIALTVGDGWYRGRYGFVSTTEIYGSRSGAAARIEVFGANGESTVIRTDSSWMGGFGQIRSASIYDGSTIDLRLATGDPSQPGFDETNWRQVERIGRADNRFEPRSAAPVRPVAAFSMIPIAGDMEDASIPVVFDATQNIAGWVRLTVAGAAGAEVVVTHAEVLESDGSLHTASLRSAKATDRYILAGEEPVTLEPVFTFHGFRYAQVAGPVRIIGAEAIAISSDLPRRAEFTSSHAALNRFHENVVWSQRDNFVSIPTDCPQRDERLGWTGDAQAFAATANTLFDSESFWMSWLRDLELDQPEDGAVASVVPNIISGLAHMGGEVIDDMGRAGWADAATIVPWSTYVSTGSTEVLERQLSSMRRWIDHLRRRAGKELLLPDEPFQYGDWLDPDAPVDQPWNAKAPARFVANAFYVHSIRILARTEGLLGHAEEAHELDALGRRLADAVWAEWSEDARKTQTGAAMCLEFDIVPEAERSSLAESLASDVRNERGRIATGFLGTPLVLFALSHSGHWEEAYSMLLRREAPSWLYQVDRGATTVWERWDAIKPDGSIHAGEMEDDEGGMISFNHYAYGAVIDWVYRNVAGLEPIEPGYRTSRIGPRPASALTSARATIGTAYGDLAISWELCSPKTLRIDLTVPFGSRAILDLPTTESSLTTVNGGPASAELFHGSYTIEVTDPAIAMVDAPAS